MKTIKVSFEISEERFLECLNLAGEDHGDDDNYDEYNDDEDRFGEMI